MYKAIFSLLVLALLAACSSTKKTSGSTTDNSMANHNMQGNWVPLFDGKTLAGWHSYGKSTPGSAWKVDNGAIRLDASNKESYQTNGGGDLVTDAEYENYHLKLEWKISPNGNSGIIINTKEDTAQFRESWYTGMEMQVLDNDGHSDGKIEKHRAANLYDLISVSKENVKPVGEWNLAEVVSNRGKLELYLNGELVVSTRTDDDNWKALLAGSKFKDMPAFGTFSKGHIGLQDHGNDVWYRNIQIMQL